MKASASTADRAAARRRVQRHAAPSSLNIKRRCEKTSSRREPDDGMGSSQAFDLHGACSFGRWSLLEVLDVHPDLPQGSDRLAPCVRRAPRAVHCDCPDRTAARKARQMSDEVPSFFPVWWVWLRALWRTRCNQCPGCNSSAPALDHCRVCGGARQPYPPSDRTRLLWLQRWVGDWRGDSLRLPLAQDPTVALSGKPLPEWQHYRFACPRCGSGLREHTELEAKDCLARFAPVARPQRERLDR